MWISKHIIVTSKEYKHHFIVDVAGIGGREKLIPGDTLTTTGLVKSRSQRSTELTPKSEAIVVVSNETMNEAEVSQDNEGLSIKML